MTARSTLPNVWRRLLTTAAVLPERTRRRERLRPQVEVSPPAHGGEEAGADRLLAAVPPLLLWRP